MSSRENTSITTDRNDTLDGIRAFSVWAVMLYHAGAPLFKGGWIGVDIFFVLSGFLITTLLLQEFNKAGQINLIAFWRRRILRLVPAYFVYMLLVSLFLWASLPESWNEDQTTSPFLYLAAYWSYLGNYLARGGYWAYESLTRHLWSLAVEQQFYLLLPPVLMLGLRIAQPALAVTALIVVFLGLTLLDLLPGMPRLVLNLRGISILVGCIAAVVAFQIQPGRYSTKTLRRLHHVGILGFIASAILVFCLSEFGWSIGQIVQSFVVLNWIFSAFFIAGLWYGWSSIVNPILILKPIAWSGRISYGLYIYHMAAWMLVFQTSFGETLSDILGRWAGYGLKLFLYFGLTYIVSWISWRVVEVPALKLKRAVPSHARSYTSS